jgi:hypothetical protein
VRGESGPDQLAGQRGNDDMFGGAGLDVGNGRVGDDTWYAVEQQVSC